MEQQPPLTHEEPPDAGWRGGTIPPTLSRQRKRQTPVKSPKSQIRGSGTLIPKPDALISST